jgi:hypothetical protein
MGLPQYMMVRFSRYFDLLLDKDTTSFRWRPITCYTALLINLYSRTSAE